MKLKMLLVVLIIIVMNIITFNTNMVKADTLEDVFAGGDSFIQAGKDKTSIDEEKLKSTSSSIFNVLSVIGIIIAVFTSAILGIKFMIGSTEDKAQIKEALVPFIIGCIVIFGAFSIWKIFVGLGNTFNTPT